MAPRRLIIAMLLLLAFSSALAILVPAPERDRPPEQGPPPETAERPIEPRPEQGEQVPAGEAVERNAERVVERSIRADGPPERISIRPGDRLVLEVRSARSVVLELVGTGLVDPAGPYDPARFDLLVREGSKRFLVRELGAEDRTIAVIQVR